MRVVAGKVKGHRIESVKGIRPTSDLVRGAIFSMLESMVSDWSRVLDLYAGTGALGIEALSRGAGWGDFVEQSPRCCAIIKENLEMTGLAGQAHVYCCSARKALSFLNNKYSVIFLDPPYSDHSINSILGELASSSLVGEGSTIVVEHSSRLPLNSAYGNFHLRKYRRHGDTCISIYQ